MEKKGGIVRLAMGGDVCEEAEKNRVLFNIFSVHFPILGFSFLGRERERRRLSEYTKRNEDNKN